MEILLEQTEWQGIKLREVAGADRREIPGGTFYDNFYKTLRDQKGLENLDAGWLRQKRSVSRWIETRFLEPMKQRIGDDFKILSLGVGLGIVEVPWLENGYRVDLQECQKSSLEAVAQRFPNATIYIGNAMEIPCPSAAYDLIVMNALDYVFDRKAYETLLHEAARLLRSGGILLGITVSNLDLKTLVSTLLSKTKQKLLGKSLRRVNESIKWGWSRTLGEHLRAGRRAKLNAETVFATTPPDSELVPLKIPSLLWRFYWPNARTVAIHWNKQ